MRPHVVIAGGGIAAVETLLALREHVRDRLDVTLVAPDPHLVLRPLAVAEAFGGAPARHYPLDSIAGDLGARLMRARVQQVSGSYGSVLLDDGEEVLYDELVIAVGAAHLAASPRILTFGGPESVPALERILAALRSGTARTIAFVVPSGPAWPLPAYELALQTAATTPADVQLVTAETEPLAVFGAAVSGGVADLLNRAGITVRCGPDAGPSAERVVAVPRLAGPRLRGLPRDDDGLVPVDEEGRVRGMRAVYAVGDGTSLPYHQGGIAAQLAGTVAAGIARRVGASVPATPFRPVLRAMLVTGERPVYLEAELDGSAVIRSSMSHECPWGEPAKIAAPYLSRYLAERDATGRYGTRDLEPAR